MKTLTTIKYVSFIPELVEEQAVLGNFNRILKYKGADEASMVLECGIPLYEMEKQKIVDEGNIFIDRVDLNTLFF